MTGKTAPFREEHVHFREHVDHIRTAARELPELVPEARHAVVERILEFLHSELIPHAEAEEQTVYREVGKVLAHPWATGPMVYDHMLIRRRIAAIEEADPDDAPLLQEHLYALHALIDAHFEKEEELYLPLLERESEDEVREVYDRLISYEHAHGRPYLAE
ncbi:MAG TPA: hemerythrin domain-containing protein, partial [Gaiellaceae bacterium]